MNKNLIIFLTFLFAINIYSQSDYEIVQSFKNRILEIENKIKESSSIEDLQDISLNVENIKAEFHVHKELLDRSLYPENYQKSIDNLNNLIVIRKGDFTEIKELQTEVVTLKTEIDALNKKNSELLNQIYTLEIQRKKDAKSIAQLQNLVRELRTSLAQRDELVYTIIDSLFPKIDVDTKILSDAQKENLIAETESKNVISLVKKSIRDNNRFVEVTTLKPQDFEEVKKQQDNFVSLWQKLGPKLVDIYASKPEKSNELRQIDALFTIWKNNLKKEVWESIRDDFSTGGINLRRFNNADEFTQTIISFIDEEINSYPVKSIEESERVFSVFTDSVWYKTINTEWMPYLVDNNFLSSQQKNLMEDKIAKWKDVIAPSLSIWIYIIAGSIIVLILIIVLMKLKKSNTSVVE